MDDVKDYTDDFLVSEGAAGDDAKEVEKRNNELDFETDPHRIQQRQRQIDFGKNTIGYQRYIERYPVKRKRPRHLPRTPDVHKKCSKRAFAGQIRAWRRRLHEWDLPNSAVEGPPVASERVHISPEMRSERSDQLENNAGMKRAIFTSERKRCGQDSDISPLKQKKVCIPSHWSDIVCKPSAMNPSDIPEDLLVSYSDDEL